MAGSEENGMVSEANVITGRKFTDKSVVMLVTAGGATCVEAKGASGCFHYRYEEKKSMFWIVELDSEHPGEMAFKNVEDGNYLAGTGGGAHTRIVTSPVKQNWKLEDGLLKDSYYVKSMVYPNNAYMVNRDASCLNGSRCDMYPMIEVWKHALTYFLKEAPEYPADESVYDHQNPDASKKLKDREDALVTKEKEAAQKEQAAAEKEQAAADIESASEKSQADLKSREDALAAREKATTDKESAAADSEAALKKREDAVAAREQASADSGSSTTTGQADLQKREDAIKAREEAAASKEAAIKKSQETSKQREGAAAERERAVGEKEKAVSKKSQAVNSSKDALAKREQAAAVTDEELKKKEAALAKKEQALANAGKQSSAADKDVASLKAENQRLKKQLEDLQKQAQQSQNKPAPQSSTGPSTDNAALKQEIAKAKAENDRLRQQMAQSAKKVPSSEASPAKQSNGSVTKQQPRPVPSNATPEEEKDIAKEIARVKFANANLEREIAELESDKKGSAAGKNDSAQKPGTKKPTNLSNGTSSDANTSAKRTQQSAAPASNGSKGAVPNGTSSISPSAELAKLKETNARLRQQKEQLQTQGQSQTSPGSIAGADHTEELRDVNRQIEELAENTKQQQERGASLQNIVKQNTANIKALANAQAAATEQMKHHGEYMRAMAMRMQRQEELCASRQCKCRHDIHSPPRKIEKKTVGFVYNKE